jgi:hypothetical protein
MRATAAEAASRRSSGTLAAAREAETSRRTGVSLTQTRPGGVDNYYTPDNFRRDYEAANPGKNFEEFFRSGLTSRPAPQPARQPSRVGIKSFR